VNYDGNARMRDDGYDMRRDAQHTHFTGQVGGRLVVGIRLAGLQLQLTQVG